MGEILILDEKSDKLGAKVQLANFPEGLHRDLVIATSNGDQQRIAALSQKYSEALAESLGIKSKDYPKNPFRVHPDYVVIDELYLIDHPQFNFFVNQILRGGMFGWDENLGTPAYVHAATQRLFNQINNHGSNTQQ